MRSNPSFATYPLCDLGQADSISQSLIGKIGRNDLSSLQPSVTNGWDNTDCHSMPGQGSSLAFYVFTHLILATNL